MNSNPKINYDYCTRKPAVVLVQEFVDGSRRVVERHVYYAWLAWERANLIGVAKNT